MKLHYRFLIPQYFTGVAQMREPVRQAGWSEMEPTKATTPLAVCFAQRDVPYPLAAGALSRSARWVCLCCTLLFLMAM